MTSAAIVNRILKGAVQIAGLWGDNQELAFPIIVKTGINAAGRTIRYYFNYSGHSVSRPLPARCRPGIVVGQPCLPRANA